MGNAPQRPHFCQCTELDVDGREMERCFYPNTIYAKQVAMIRKLNNIILFLFLALNAFGQADTVSLENPSEDFVIASVVIASPGEEIYSAVGHAFLRLECPQHKLDYVFSYEAEDVDHNVLRFFAGDLKMGIRAVPTKEYLDDYAKEGRGAVSYELNLPIAVKQRLWQQMDEEMLSDDIPYDYMNHSCSVSVLEWLERTIGEDNLDYGEWPEKFKTTRKKIAADGIRDSWILAFCYTFMAGEGDDPDVSLQSKVIIPAELEELLHRTKAYGKPIIKGKPKVLLKKSKEITYTWFTPFVASLILLVIAIANIFMHWRVPRIAFLSIGTLMGLFVWYLVFISDLTCTKWNWLVIPFCPFVLLFWRWRKYWLLPYAGICIAWVIGLMIYPHQMVDHAHLAFALTMALTYFEIYKSKIKNK